MSDEVSCHAIEPTSGPNLLRFQLIDLVCLITWAAVLFALMSPFMGRVSAFELFAFIVGILVQVSAFVGVILYRKDRRAQALGTGGRFLEFAEECPLDHRGARLLCGMVILAFIMFIQNLLALAFSSLLPFLWFFIFVSIYLPGSFAVQYFKVWLGHGSGRLEFFENGIVLLSHQFVPWSLIEAKSYPSQPQRVTFVLRFPHKTPEVRIYEVEVTEQLWSWLTQREILT